MSQCVGPARCCILNIKTWNLSLITGVHGGRTEPIPKLSFDLHACLQTHTLIIVRIINKSSFNKIGSVELVQPE